MADKVVIEAEVKSNIGGVSKDASEAAGNISIMGVSLNSVKAGFASAGKQAKLMFGSIKAGLISTGIGAFVVLIGSLVSYFTNTKRGADQLAQAFTAMGSIVSVLTDRLSKVGEALSFIFSGEFRKAGKALQGTFAGIADEVEREVRAMVELKKRTQELRDADMDFMVQKAKTRQEIEKARLIAEDETKSAKERLENLKTALELEAETTKQEIVLAKERMLIQKEEMALSETLVEDEQELARLKTDIIEKETASIKMRRRVVTEVNALEREIHAEQMARLKERKDADKEREGELTMMPKLTGEVNNEIIKSDNAVLDNYINTIRKKKEFTNKFTQDQLAAYSHLAGALSSLAGENKQLAVAQAVIDTYAAANAALKQGAGSGLGFINAAAIIATGLANVRQIMQTEVPSGGGGSVPTATAQGPAPQTLCGSFELTGAVKPEPVQAFVVSDDITNNQDKLATIRRRATI